MLTQEGQEAARECIMRSGLADPSSDTNDSEGHYDLDTENMLDLEPLQPDSAREVTSSSGDLTRKKPVDIPVEYMDRVYLHLASKFAPSFSSIKESGMPLALFKLLVILMWTAIPDLNFS